MSDSPRCVQCNAPVAKNVYLCESCVARRSATPPKPAPPQPCPPQVSAPTPSPPSTPPPPSGSGSGTRKKPLLSPAGIFILTVLFIVFVIPSLIGAYNLHSALGYVDGQSQRLQDSATRHQQTQPTLQHRRDLPRSESAKDAPMQNTQRPWPIQQQAQQYSQQQAYNQQQEAFSQQQEEDDRRRVQQRIEELKPAVGRDYTLLMNETSSFLGTSFFDLRSQLDQCNAYIAQCDRFLSYYQDFPDLCSKVINRESELQKDAANLQVHLRNEAQGIPDEPIPE